MIIIELIHDSILKCSSQQAFPLKNSKREANAENMIIFQGLQALFRVRILFSYFSIRDYTHGLRRHIPVTGSNRKPRGEIMTQIEQLVFVYNLEKDQLVIKACNPIKDKYFSTATSQKTTQY
ncbi:hypothetical protein IMG5_046210 [Ichthyophthirius multifiliis]|uniref:Uncharacterized protein n=1 Tax=Ichthyophthirius multifiliis TaxID=5932 RepID=G0QM84_ICHMU|nr:hypothetical protein IMG5_046210 [Ichthyophthirius multifiliis]EGR33671.1 hypothetical protein IMG5_046210 [Ichthyophthirius multifiliis]|eukprot:XP_004037657.1 hypothetical protein IMG5_046210 [Ichthyophthirius multifiliis]